MPVDCWHHSHCALTVAPCATPRASSAQPCARQGASHSWTSSKGWSSCCPLDLNDTEALCIRHVDECLMHMSRILLHPLLSKRLSKSSH